MSTIYVDIADHDGDVPKTSPYKDQIACSAIRHAISLPVTSGATRTQGVPNNGPIALIHRVDKASPKLKLSALKGNPLGKVIITRVSTIAGRSVAVETITLTDTYVVRVDVETPLVKSTLELSDELMETFYLTYGAIDWSHEEYAGNVRKGTRSGEYPRADG